MLTRQDLEALASQPENDHWYLSLYLNVDPVVNPRQEYVRQARLMVEKELERVRAAGAADKAQMRALEARGQALLDYLVLSRSVFKKGLIIFTSADGTQWREYHLAVPVSPLLVINRRPYLQPLAHIIDDHEACAVVLVDRRQARLFLIHLGELLAYHEESHPELPGKQKTGGWRAYEEGKWSRWVEKLVTLHLEDVVRILENLVAEKEVRRVVLGGPVEAVSQFKELLPATLRALVVAEVEAELFRPGSDVVADALALMREVERRREDEIVKEMYDRMMSGSRAVAGFDDVLDAITQGKVYRLAVAAGLERPGYRCPGCGSLFTVARENCYLCGRQLEEDAHLTDLLVQQALNQGALIEVVRSDQPLLTELGGIAALLRFV